mgnify:CR=1 FL=1
MQKWILKIDNSVMEGDTAEQVITDIYKSARFADATIEEYRASFAQRLITYNGMVVRSSGNQELFDDLVKIGLLIKL